MEYNGSMKHWLYLLLPYPDYTDELKRISRQLTRMNKEIKSMAMNFERLTAAVDRISQEVSEVAERIRDPKVDNNSQSVIDDLAGRLEGAADALDAVADDSSEAEAAEATPDADTLPPAEEEATFMNGSDGGSELGGEQAPE